MLHNNRESEHLNNDATHPNEILENEEKDKTPSSFKNSSKKRQDGIFG